MTNTPANRTVDMPTGGQVLAVVPQTFAEIQRVANAAITSGIAPRSLVKFVKDSATPEEQMAAAKHNTAAVATAIMAGAELGLPPMVSLRAFTVINGRPALYADGNVSVVRKAKTRDGEPIAKTLKSGFVAYHPVICPVCEGRFASEQLAIQHLVMAHEKEHDRLHKANVTITFEADTDVWLDTSYGYCESTRADTGESVREMFTIAQAKKARLWDDRDEIEREVWEYNPAARKREPVTKLVPNDSPWHCYPQRMLIWRATGYLLRWLYADVLGGMPDEYEARAMTIDVTPNDNYFSASTDTPVYEARPSPPSMPDDVEDDPVSEITEEQQVALSKLNKALGKAKTVDELEEIFDEADVPLMFDGHEAAIDAAFSLRKIRTDFLKAQAAPKEPTAIEEVIAPPPAPEDEPDENAQD